MVAISGPSLGYAGSITETTGKDYWNRIGASKYGVVGSGDLKVSTTTGDRMLLVASGIAWGHNIQDTLATSVSVQLNSVASGSRYDLVVVRRDVTAKTTVEVVQGTGTKAIPSLTSTAASHADQPIALCRVDAGSTTVQEIIDLRCWAANGGVVITNQLALDYLNIPGARVLQGGTEYRYLPDALGVFGWESRETMFREWNANTAVTTTGAGGTKSVSFPAGLFTIAPLVQATKQGAQSAKYIPYVTDITTSGCTVGLYSGDGSGATTTTTIAIRAVQTAPNRSTGINP